MRGGKCVYGKLFRGKAGFVSLEWFPEFANYRRDSYDFDTRCDDGLVFYKAQHLYEAVDKSGSILTPALKSICNYRKGGNKGFETVITRLQMQTYITIADFEYRTDKNGKQYGWGVARYATPEFLLGRKVIPVISSSFELLVKLVAGIWMIPMFGYLCVCLTEPIIWTSCAFFLIAVFLIQKPLGDNKEKT